MSERFEPNKRPWALAPGGEEGLGIRVIDATGQTVGYFLDWRTAELVVEDSKIGDEPKSALLERVEELTNENDSLQGKCMAAEQRVLELEEKITEARVELESAQSILRELPST